MLNTILKDLNKEQQKAVQQINGSMIILAGAGSGKTRCITYRVAYMIVKGIKPENILAVTFTNKTATEMKERIENFVQAMHGTKSALPTVTTFHSFCAKVLRREAKHVGLSNSFVIYDKQDQLDAVKQAMETLGLSIKEYKPNSLLAMILGAKNQMIGEAEYLSMARGQFQQVAAQVYRFYQKILQVNNAVDFDDLIMLTVKLFKENPWILERYQDTFPYILIDEYQDTNQAQYMLTKLLAKKRQNICVVGDFSQSIYSWRGADFQNLIKFKSDFHDVKTYALSQNYRSTQRILDGASAVIAKNTTHPVLELWTENPDGEEIEIYEAASEQDEADFIVRIIKQHGEERLRDIAVLYRTNAQSRSLEEALLHHGIPYILVGGTRFYERKEIKDVLAYLRIFINEKDSVSQKRIEKLGKGRLKKFQETKERLQQSNEELTTIFLLDTILKETEYLSLFDEKDEEDRSRLENIKELRSVALKFPVITEFLENIALVEQEETVLENEDDRKNAVTLMTLHSAKGLEFPMVFMVGMEEGLFPHSRALMDRSELEEERRLCYVGMTRAQKKLFLTYARRRLFFGQRNTNTVSRFIFELPERALAKSYYDLHNKDIDEPEYF